MTNEDIVAGIEIALDKIRGNNYLTTQGFFYHNNVCPKAYSKTKRQIMPDPYILDSFIKGTDNSAALLLRMGQDVPSASKDRVIFDVLIKNSRHSAIRNEETGEYNHDLIQKIVDKLMEVKADLLAIQKVLPLPTPEQEESSFTDNINPLFFDDHEYKQEEETSYIETEDDETKKRLKFFMESSAEELLEKQSIMK